MRSSSDHDLLRLSLVFVWLATAAVSVWELHGQSMRLLVNAGVHPTALAEVLVLGGAGVDLLLGLSMWRWPTRRVYVAALVVMGAMTLSATVLQPALWMDPLGRLTKNVPIAAILLVLIRAKP